MSRGPTVPPGPESRDIGPISRWSPDRKLLTAAIYGAQAAPPEVSKVPALPAVAGRLKL